MTDTIFNDTYPELVTDWSLMREIETRGVVERKIDKEGDDTECWVEDENPDFYSVYVRSVEGWSECISDQSIKTDALEFMVSMQMAHPHLRKGRQSLTGRS